MGTPMVRSDTLEMLARLQKEYPNKSPYIFGSKQMYAFGQGFEQLNLKIFEADEETYIPGAMCINAEVLNRLADCDTVVQIDAYMATAKRVPKVGQIGVYRSMAMILMLSCVGYTFNYDTFPYLRNLDINQMWADMEQMTKGSHMVCIILSVAMRGRSHGGFTKRHAERCKVPPVSIPDVPVFYANARPTLFRPPPPPPPRIKPGAAANAAPPTDTKSPSPSELPKSFASALDNKR